MIQPVHFLLACYCGNKKSKAASLTQLGCVGIATMGFGISVMIELKSHPLFDHLAGAVGQRAFPEEDP
jgi:hypothetical protein